MDEAVLSMGKAGLEKIELPCQGMGPRWPYLSRPGAPSPVLVGVSRGKCSKD